MKTSKKFNLVNKISAFLFICASAFFMTSCQEEDLPMPVRSSDGIAAGRQIAPRSDAFEMIKIDHIAARTSMADYSVSVKSDGIVTFEGRRNVAVIRKETFKISEARLAELSKMFTDAKFNSINDKLTIVPDLPYHLTTYCASAELRSKTILDNSQEPLNLIDLRIRVEKVLDISKYVIVTSVPVEQGSL